MFLMTREAEDERAMIEAKTETEFRTAVFASDLHYGLKVYKTMFEDSSEDGYTPETETDFKKMMIEMRRLELAGEL